MSSLKNWIPYSLKYDSGDWILNWLDLQAHLIKEPFFEETISKCKSRMLEGSLYKSQSTVDFLIETARHTISIEPTAFIFHVSRCGSTLLSQALGIDNENIVIAEAPLLDEILRAKEQDGALEEQDLEIWFKAVLTMMGQERAEPKKNYFIKLDSWHLHFYTQLRAWFPKLPFYFLSREPHAVIYSHSKRRGIHTISSLISPKLLKVDFKDHYFWDFKQYTAEILQRYYEVLTEIKAENNPLNYFYDYGFGVNQMVEDFIKVIGLKTDKQPEMLSRLQQHSKYPDQAFSEEKVQIEVDDYLEAAKAYKTLLTLIGKPKN